MPLWTLLLSTVLATRNCALALIPERGRVKNVMPIFADEEVPTGAAPSNLKIRDGYFNQTVDHFGSQQGVNGSWFQQYYIVQDTFYKPGGPIFFYVSGEEALIGQYLTGGVGSILSWLMPKYNAMAVSLEHRFYGAGLYPNNPGRSVPTADLSPESLALLTFPQAIEDNVNFIKSFSSLHPEYNVPPNTKWIAVGGSYPGALATWMRDKHPDVVYAAHASSAPVQLQMNYWRYSYAIDEGMTFMSNLYYKNFNSCMCGWTRAVKLLDRITLSLANDTAKMTAFKKSFWMSQITDNRDFTVSITSSFAQTVQYYPDSMQIGSTTLLSLMCSGVVFPAFTNTTATDADLLQSMQGLWIQRLKSYGFQNDSDPRIGKTFNTVPLKDFSFQGAYQYLWNYQTCSQLGFGQLAQPLDGGLIEDYSVYSQLNDLDYYEWTCKVTGLTSNPSDAPMEAYNNEYHGLNVQTSNILWVNGQYDPWRYLSNYVTAPGPDQDLLVYENATHCNDLWGPLPVNYSRVWPRVTMEYETSFFNQIFEVYDKWIGNTTVNATTSTSQSVLPATTATATKSILSASRTSLATSNTSRTTAPSSVSATLVSNSTVVGNPRSTTALNPISKTFSATSYQSGATYLPPPNFVLDEEASSIASAMQPGNGNVYQGSGWSLKYSAMVFATAFVCLSASL